MITGGMLWRYFDEAQRRQGVEAFCDRDVEGAPAGRQITNGRCFKAVDLLSCMGV
jgi:hypothetical protein